ncbi:MULTISPECIES: FUSC family protein [Hyphomicrobiales]|uniref:FUSC family protein n=1 Tax=Hyphomicrobiales TaxID=356 RepID=UPI00178C43C9|nr:FUSC family protein [Brucella anthropi]
MADTALLPSPQQHGTELPGDRPAGLESEGRRRENGISPETRKEKPAIFAVRTTIAALLALAAAAALDIQHPWWAAMTVWLVAQPTRGLLLERSLARLAGTGCGAAVGAVILYGLEGRPLLSLVALVPWLALCAGFGNLFRHFRNYGSVLAGYTAAIIVLFGLDAGRTDAALAMDRVLCTIIGIVCSAIASIRAIPGRDQESLDRRLDHVICLSLDLVQAHLCNGSSRYSPERLVVEIGALERTADEMAAGSVTGRRLATHVRCVAGLLLELAALTSQPAARAVDGPARVGGTGNGRIADLAASAMASGRPDLGSVLGELSLVVNLPRRAVLFGDLWAEVDPSAILRAAARPIVALSLASVIWWSTGWSVGAMMTMTAILFSSLFSSNDQGNHLVLQVLIGTLCGAVFGVAARLFLLPEAGSLPAVLAIVAPFLLFGAWLMRGSITAKMAIDLNMTFLLTAQPFSAPAAPDIVFSETGAIIVGVAIAVATFWLILPATPGHRFLQLAHRIVDLTRRAASGGDITGLLRRVRAANVKLLHVSDPASDLSRAARDCLAAVRRAVVVREYPNCPEVSPAAADDTLRRASAALNALIPTK